VFSHYKSNKDNLMLERLGAIQMGAHPEKTPQANTKRKGAKRHD
jgi:hypothetical protein